VVSCSTRLMVWPHTGQGWELKSIIGGGMIRGGGRE